MEPQSELRRKRVSLKVEKSVDIQIVVLVTDHISSVVIYPKLPYFIHSVIAPFDEDYGILPWKSIDLREFFYLQGTKEWE